MNLKNKIREFFTLTRRQDGFTLVELIVVIAILAILGGVAVPAYSGYVTKANKAADEMLVNNLYNATMLGLMDNANHQFADRVVVKLSNEEDAEVVTDAETPNEATAADVALVEGFIKAAFGENWQEVCKLKYDGWEVTAKDVTAAYKDSSLVGKEKQLLTTTSQMANNLAVFLGNGKDMPDAIKNTMKDYGYSDTSDTTTFANAAVLTLAKDFSEYDDAIVDAFSAGSPNAISSKISEVAGTMYSDDSDMAVLASAALYYAYATTFSEYVASTGDTYAKDQMTALNNNLASAAQGGMKARDILNMVSGTFGGLFVEYSKPEKGNMVGQYIDPDNGQGAKDAAAIVTAMSGVTESAGALAGNLSNANCYADASGLVDSYLAVGSQLTDGYTAGIVCGTDNGVNYVRCYLGDMH